MEYVKPGREAEPSRRNREPHYTTSIRDDTGEILFCETWEDGRRRTYWLPFWTAIAHGWGLMWKGHEVTYDE
jgi:hypothetical protein